MQIKQTTEFAAWLRQLKDPRGRTAVMRRLDRLAAGNPGDHRNLKNGVSELRLRVGPGYRVYYTQRGNRLVIILCGGDKSTQSRDIERATDIAQALDAEP